MDFASQPHARLPGIRDIWTVFQELCAGLEAVEAQTLERRFGHLWGARVVEVLADFFRREFGQPLAEARLSSVVEALGDVCQRAELGRCALDFEDAGDGLVHVWQYACPLASDEALSSFACAFLEGFHGSTLAHLAGRRLRVRWLAIEPRRGVLRFLAASSTRVETWQWPLGGVGRPVGAELATAPAAGGHP